MRFFPRQTSARSFKFASSSLLDRGLRQAGWGISEIQARKPLDALGLKPFEIPGGVNARAIGKQVCLHINALTALDAGTRYG